MMESLDRHLQRLAALADRTELPAPAEVRRRGEARRRHRRIAVAAGSLLLLAGIATPVAIALAGASTQRIPPTTKKPTTTMSTPSTSTTTTSSTTTATTSPPSAAAAVSLAQQGQRLSYVATYSLTAASDAPSPAPSRLIVAQVGNPAGGWPTEWSYTLEWSNGWEAEMEQQPGGQSGLIYQCQRLSAQASWTCQGPDGMGGGNAMHAAIEPYEPMTQYDFLLGILHPLYGTSTASSEIIAGQRVQCVTAPASPPETWCFTPQGVFASFPQDNELDPYARGLGGQLVAWSESVPADQFVPPATPTAWTGPWALCRQGPCVAVG
jgi:hypothetical protein